MADALAAAASMGGFALVCSPQRVVASIPCGQDDYGYGFLSNLPTDIVCGLVLRITYIGLCAG